MQKKSEIILRRVKGGFQAIRGRDYANQGNFSLQDCK